MLLYIVSHKRDKVEINSHVKQALNTREGFLRKKHSWGFIFFKTMLYTHILNIYRFH